MAYLRSILLLILAITSTHQIKYKASVVEYGIGPTSPNGDKQIEDNLQRYINFIREASKQNVDIIIFPESTFNTDLSSHGIESGLVVPDHTKDNKPPCDTTEYNWALKKLSCEAKNSQIYIALNILEKLQCNILDANNCPADGHNVFNTNIVFDKMGRVVSRYRKPQMLKGMSFTSTTVQETEPEFFTTDFGVTFGHLIGSDMVASEPASILLDKGIKNFIAPNMWYSKLPFLTAVQFQESWALTHNVNLLAAGVNSPKDGLSGSGIYSGSNGALTAFISGKPQSRMLTATLDSELNEDLPKGSIESVDLNNLNLLKDDLEAYSYKPLNLSAHGGYTETICHKAFCCKIYTKFSINEDISNDNDYMMVAFDGVQNDSSLKTSGTQTCGIVACITDHISTCGKLSENTALKQRRIKFEEISIYGLFKRSNSLFPISLQDDLLPFSPESFQYQSTSTQSNSNYSRVKYTLLEETDSLVTFAVFGRDFSKDGSIPSEEMQEHVDSRYSTQDFQADMQDNIMENDNESEEMEQSYLEYFYNRLQILVFIVTIYCLEQI